MKRIVTITIITLLLLVVIHKGYSVVDDLNTDPHNYVSTLGHP